jgi:hypothetical protein
MKLVDGRIHDEIRFTKHLKTILRYFPLQCMLFCSGIRIHTQKPLVRVKDDLRFLRHEYKFFYRRV